MISKYIKYYKNYTKYIIPINNIANDVNIFPSNFNNLGYKKIGNILSYYKPYLYKGEAWKNYKNKYCIEEKFNIKKDKNNIRIVTFNVHNWTKRCNMAKNVEKNTSNKIARNINIFIEKFKTINADILCLQEVVPIFENIIDKNINDVNYIKKNLNFKFLVKEMEKIGYKYNYITNTQHSYIPIPLDYDEYFILANGIFSKIPIKNTQGYKLPGNRTFIECMIEINGKDVLLYNTHIDYFPKLKVKELLDDSFKKVGPFDNITSLQIDLLILHIVNKMKVYNTCDVILCGDFNKPYVISNKLLKIYKYRTTKTNFRLLLNFFKDSYNICHKDIETHDPKRITNFSSELATDFIFISKYFSLDICNCEVIKTDISDHYPVMIDVI